MHVASKTDSIVSAGDVFLVTISSSVAIGQAWVTRHCVADFVAHLHVVSSRHLHWLE